MLALHMAFEDRRRKRSADPLVALHYQLATTRRDTSVETLVLADASGVMVAGAGAWAACEELAAYAPLLADTHERLPSEPFRFASLRSEVELRMLSIDGQRVLLCARAPRRDHGLHAALDRAAAGVARILAA